MRMSLNTALNTFKKQKQKHSSIILKQSYIPLSNQLQEEWERVVVNEDEESSVLNDEEPDDPNDEGNERIVVNQEEFYISEAFFHDLISTDYGGAIYSTIDDVKLYIEKTTFDNCQSALYGGAIYMDCITSDCSFNMSFVCGTHCKCNDVSTLSYGQFCYLLLGYLSSNLNNIFESSIIFNENEKMAKTLFEMYYGNQIVNYTNITNNRIHYHSGIDLYPYGSNSFIHLIAYSNFYNNTALYLYCIYFGDRGAQNKFIESSNFILNKQEADLIRIHEGKSEIKSSSFIENDVGSDHLIYTSGQTIVHEDCYFSETNIYGKIGNENVILPSKQAEEFTIFLEIFITRFCDYLGDEESSILNDEESSYTNEDESSDTNEDESSDTNDEESRVLNEEESNDLNDDDLGGGEIAGISIACIVVVIIIVGLLVFFMRKRKRIDEEKLEKKY